MSKKIRGKRETVETEINPRTGGPCSNSSGGVVHQPSGWATLAPKGKGAGFIGRHSLSIAATAILILWIVAYCYSDPGTHLGSFFGNAIADWSGVVVMVFATKHLYEKGSSESRRPEGKLPPPLEWLREHSLTIFLLATGSIWIAIYLRVDSEGKWGQVVGNIVSEWTQILGLVLLTKRLIELHSKESER